MAVDPISAVNRQPGSVLEVMDALELSRLARVEAQAELQQAEAADAVDEIAPPPAAVPAPPELPEQDDALQLSSLAFARSRGVAGADPETLAEQTAAVTPAEAQALAARAALNEALVEAAPQPVVLPAPDPLQAALLQDRLDQASTTVQPFMVYGVAINGSDPVVNPAGVAVDEVGPVNPAPAVPAVEAATDTPADPLRIADSGPR
ncbi:hypothetical protein [Chitinolyticbacter meiyuanensis]|uniref:hypothetical protein n=1 Tax=Chitinolyticbacter meiyuanensis TaxID=682798 RepID=UPI0011E589BC|nr:hypothetical protein [Chitinolyticbacter meiyuanensis]